MIRYPMPPIGPLAFPLKFGRTSAPFLHTKRRFKIGKMDVIRPCVRTDRDRMAALVILTVDKHAADAGAAHLGEGDLLRAGEGGHGS